MEDVAGVPLRVLLAEDSEDDAALLVRQLRRNGYRPTWQRIEDPTAMRAALDTSPWDLVISDSSMPQFSAAAALAILQESGLDVPFIIVSGTIGEEAAVAAMRAGASDFLLKNNLARLVPVIERELRDGNVRAARRNAEKELLAASDRHRVMFEGNPLPMWVFDSKTNEFLVVNDAAVRHYGYSREEFAAMKLEDIGPAEDVAAMRERLATPSLDSGVWRHRKKDGSVITVEITARKFVLDGRPARLVVANDVTERRKLEEQLRQSQKMDAIGRLAGGVAHDFNNILSVILSYSEMLLGDLDAGQPMREDIQEIYDAGKRAADLTRQLLMFSRQQVLEPRVLDLNEVLGGMDRMLRRILGADVDLASVPSKPLGSVRVDPGSMEQIIMNLAVNARDAMPTGGKLTIETADVMLDEAYANDHVDAKAGPHVMVAVSDTGMGMDRATQARIFEPFFTTKDKSKGTGLGLSTVFGIVQQSEGSIWVYSEPGQGTTFKVYLPRVDAEADSLRSMRSAAIVGGTETILLVEDDDQVRAVSRGLLQKYGYHVIEARNAVDALQHLESESTAIDLLLTDVVMPQMSGPELARRARTLRPSLRVLCMSGYTDDSIVRHGVLESRVAYLQKPFTPETLTRKVRDVLEAPGET
jgi:two-component system cell cycle sensor histidine kinase/response regulator CckA